jgi:TetR/AcrR family tetracycline transcriptional repressor
VHAALTILDEVGLPDLTMRRLATALGIRQSALYWHFANKQTMLAAVSDRIVADALATLPDHPDGPAPDAAAVARALRDGLLVHPDGAEIVLSTHALGLGVGQAEAALTSALSARGPAVQGRADAVLAAPVLLQFVLGHASLVQQRLQAARLGVIPGDETADDTSAAQFRLGLDLLLDGPRRKLDALGGDVIEGVVHPDLPGILEALRAS